MAIFNSYVSLPEGSSYHRAIWDHSPMANLKLTTIPMTSRREFMIKLLPEISLWNHIKHHIYIIYIYSIIRSHEIPILLMVCSSPVLSSNFEIRYQTGIACGFGIYGLQNHHGERRARCLSPFNWAGFCWTYDFSVICFFCFHVFFQLILQRHNFHVAAQA